MTREDIVVEITNLTTKLGNQVVLQNLNLNIRRGEILAVVGGSGSGKTTLLRSILMLTESEGSIGIFGKNILKASEKELHFLRERWGVMFQRGALFSSLTVLENIAFPLCEYTNLKPNIIDEIAKLKLLLAGLNLSAATKYPSELSGGMQKRASLARAIAMDPDLLFLDEPTAGLDPKGASALDELILQLRDILGFTVIIVTHDLDTLWRITDRVAFLGEGKILQVDPMEKLNQSTVPLIQDYFSDPRSKVARKITEEY